MVTVDIGPQNKVSGSIPGLMSIYLDGKGVGTLLTRARCPSRLTCLIIFTTFRKQNRLSNFQSNLSSFRIYGGAGIRHMSMPF